MVDSFDAVPLHPHPHTGHEISRRIGSGVSGTWRCIAPTSTSANQIWPVVEPGMWFTWYGMPSCSSRSTEAGPDPRELSLRMTPSPVRKPVSDGSRSTLSSVALSASMSEISNARWWPRRRWAGSSTSCVKGRFDRSPVDASRLGPSHRRKSGVPSMRWMVRPLGCLIQIVTNSKAGAGILSKPGDREGAPE